MPDLYENILHIDKDTFESLKVKGVLRSNIEFELKVYAYYLEEISNGTPKMQAMINASDEFFISDSVVKRIVYNLRKK